MDKNPTYDRRDRNSRISVIDLLRALALFAIVLAHSHDHFNCYVYPSAESQPGWLNTLNDAATWFSLNFLGGKAFMLFSFLFGMSFFIQLDRAEARGTDFRLRFAWRLALLAMFGVFHTVFYDGDILSLFALQGLLLIPFYRAKTRTLLLTGLGCIILLPIATYFLKWLLDTDYLFSYAWENKGRDRDEVFMNGSFFDVSAWNFMYGQTSKWKYIIESGRIGQTFGLFLLGLWIGRMRLFENIRENKPLFLKIFVYSLPCWLVLWALSANTGINMLVSTMNLFFLAAFVSGVVLLSNSGFLRQLSSIISPVGRMTLTCYILQSVFFCFFFYGWGLQMAPKLGTFYSMSSGAAFFFVQALAAKWWLKHYKYGPLEWLWRSGTHTKWQPLKHQ